MPADDHQYCLRWNNHQSTLISVFDTLLMNGTLVDCTLAAEGQYLNAHRVILSACSPYLEVLLSQHSEKHPIVMLKDVTFVELKAMVDYMYRGEVNVSQDQLGTFLKSAESLQIKGLSDNGTDRDNDRDVGSTAPRRQDPPPRKVPSTTPPILQPRAQPTLSVSSGFEHRRTSSQLCSDSPRNGSISPSLKKRKRIRRSSNGEDSNITANDTSNSCDLPLQAQAQSTPLASNIAPLTIATMPTPTVPPAANPTTEIQTFNRLDTSNFKTPSEPFLEPKTEYRDYLLDDNSVEDLTLDDDDDDIQPGPLYGSDPSQQGFSQWHMSGDQTGTADEVFMAAQEAVNAQQRDSQGPVDLSAKLNERDILVQSMERAREMGLHLDHNLISVMEKRILIGNFLHLQQYNRVRSLVNFPNETSRRSFCPNCNKNYSCKSALNRHLKLECGKEPQFKCPDCPRRYTQRSSLMSHLKKFHCRE